MSQGEVWASNWKQPHPSNICQLMSFALLKSKVTRTIIAKLGRKIYQIHQWDSNQESEKSA